MSHRQDPSQGKNAGPPSTAERERGLGGEGAFPLDQAVELIPAAATGGLRHRILRPNQPREACVYPNDNEPTSAHFGAFHNSTLVGVASIFQEPMPDAWQTPARPVASHLDWRLRGMATDEAVRGEGYGGAMARACLHQVMTLGGRRLWCNGRSTVVGFYRRFGFETVGDEFDLPGLGPHFVMQAWTDEP